MSTQRLTQIAELQREPTTDAHITIENDYAQIHAGKYFTYATHFNILTTATAKFTLVTPATGHIHLRPLAIVSSADKLTMNFYEGSSGNSDGTAITPINRNRNSALAAAVVLKSGVTVTTNGTKLTESYLAGAEGIGQTRTGAQLARTNEWVLKPSTVYTYELINGSDATNTVFVEFQWYESAE